jgi:NAD+ kinase
MTTALKQPLITIVSSETPQAQEAHIHLKNLFPVVPPEQADIIIALGGDGFMLETLHQFLKFEKPVYGMNCGSVGFLMNDYKADYLLERLRKAEKVQLHPLEMTAITAEGESSQACAINEVSLLRETRQATKIRILVDNVVRLEELVCDGILISTPAGSSAYNLSAHGPIIPLGANLLALTPISAFRPRRWRGALLPHSARVTFEVLEADKRPVIAAADFTEVRNVIRVEIIENKNITLTLLFDPEHNLEDRIINEQFLS